MIDGNDSRGSPTFCFKREEAIPCVYVQNTLGAQIGEMQAFRHVGQVS
jgi:hypothetical protein